MLKEFLIQQVVHSGGRKALNQSGLFKRFVLVVSSNIYSFRFLVIGNNRSTTLIGKSGWCFA